MTDLRFKRDDVLKRLRDKIARKEAILVCGAGAGLIARLENQSGADIIVVYSSGHYRISGHPAIAGNLPLGDSNQIVYDMGKNDILPMVRDTPVAAGVYGLDVTRDLGRFMEQLGELGYSGVISFPTVAKFSGDMRRELESVGLGFQREVDMLALARQKGFFTMSYCYSPEEARRLAAVGTDIIISHCGLTTGGDVGAREQDPLDLAAERTQAILSAALEEHPGVIPLCHGGSIATPEDAAYVIGHSCAKGFVGASSVERLPVERAIKETVAAYRAIRLA